MEADAELVRRALARDQQAFAALYDRYADKLYDYSRRLTGNAADAADIVQDTFVLAIQRMHQLRDPSLVRPWLYAIARSEVHRRHRRVKRLQFTEPDAQAAMSSDAPSADDLVHQQELRTLFAEAANGLDPSDREVLDLHLRHSMTSAEIAASLGIPERQVSVVVQRVRERLGRSIGVVLLAKTPNCAELTALQRSEGSPLTVLSRKRLARHIEGCLTCSQQLSDRMRPEALLAAVPIALAPAFLRNGVLQRMADVANLATTGNTGAGSARSNIASDGGNTKGTSNTANGNTGDGGNIADGKSNGNGDATKSSVKAGRQSISRRGSPRAALPSREGGRVWHESDGFPRPASSLRRIVVTAIAAAAVLLLFVVAVVNGSDSAKRVAVGATTSFSERSLFPDDVTSTSAPATTSPLPTNVATTLAASGLPTSPVITAAPTVKPTTSPTTRPTTPTTTQSTTPTTAATTTPTTSTPPTTAPDTTAPVFQSAAASPTALSSADATLAPTCIDPSATTSVITANVTDDRGVASVRVQYNAAGTPYDVSMTKVGNAWQVTIGPFPSTQVAPGITHQINAQFTATDTSGNTQAFNAASIASLLGCTVIL